MSNDNVVVVDFKQGKEVENDLVREIKELVYSYAGRMSIASAFGCIEVAKHALTEEVLG